MKQKIETTNAPAAIGPYSQGVTFGDFVFSSGNLPLDPATKEAPESIEDQTKQALLNLKAVLETAGVSMDDVVKTTVFLDDMGEFARMNGVYAEFFNAPFPARSAVEVAKLPLGVKVEIEAIAYKG